MENVQDSEARGSGRLTAMPDVIELHMTQNASTSSHVEVTARRNNNGRGKPHGKHK